jgi:hypothetical protein
MSSLKNITKSFILAGLLLSTSLGLVVNAETVDLDKYQPVATKDISVYPCEPKKDIPQSASWILEKGKAGDEINACVIVANPTAESKNIKIGAQDMIPASEGNIGMSGDNDELKSVGSWIDLKGFPESKQIEPNKGEKIEFKIKIPSDTKAGEYGGAISIMEIAKEEVKGNFKIEKRYGARIYLTVEPESDLKLGTEFKTFEFITPKSTIYDQFIKQAFGYKFDDIVMTWNLQNTGNIFSKTKGKLTVTDPDGQTKTKDVSRDFFPNYNTYIQYFPTDTKWTKPGNYKARFDFTNESYVPWTKPKEIKDVSPQKFVETEFTITQADLDKVKADKEQGGTVIDTKPPITAESGEIKSLVEESSSSEVKKEEVKTESSLPLSNIALISGGVVILVLLVGLAVFFVMKKSKKEDKEEVKKEETDKESK